MKKINILYWILTGLFAAFMIFTAIPDITVNPEAVKFMTDLGYPVYLLMFLGVAKILGSIAILIPGFPRIKEWAYAGLMFDLIGAMYSVAALNGVGPAAPFVIFLALGFASYFMYHKKLKETASAA